jgi:hypothetical protein
VEVEAVIVSVVSGLLTVKVKRIPAKVTPQKDERTRKRRAWLHGLNYEPIPLIHFAGL